MNSQRAIDLYFYFSNISQANRCIKLTPVLLAIIGKNIAFIVCCLFALLIHTLALCCIIKVLSLLVIFHGASSAMNKNNQPIRTPSRPVL
jgi:hypothetical protein